METLLTLTHAGNRYAGFTEASLVALGVPPAAIAAARAAERRELIKTECRRRIYGVASSEAQMNVTTMATAACAKTPADRSAEDVALLEALQAAVAWVMSMRARFAELAHSDNDIDYSADAAWPVCPPAVIALYQQF